jgi:hypothetical protein
MIASLLIIGMSAPVLMIGLFIDYASDKRAGIR